jgi:hypothetical protein
MKSRARGGRPVRSASPEADLNCISTPSQPADMELLGACCDRWSCWLRYSRVAIYRLSRPGGADSDLFDRPAMCFQKPGVRGLRKPYGVHRRINFGRLPGRWCGWWSCGWCSCGSWLRPGRLRRGSLRRSTQQSIDFKNRRSHNCFLLQPKLLLGTIGERADDMNSGPICADKPAIRLFLQHLEEGASTTGRAATNPGLGYFLLLPSGASVPLVALR